MTTYNKLVRDKIPEILDAKGIEYEQRVANDDEYVDALVAKLHEEMEEFSEAADIEELADIIEVIASLKTTGAYQDVEAIREKKKVNKGGFEKRLILKGEK